MEVIKSKGIIIFDPIPKTGKVEKLFKPFWAIITTNDDVDKYYRWFLEKEKGLILQAPAWGPHITILDGEPINEDLWEKVKNEYHNKEIEFEHEIFIKTNSKHWWLKVYCPEILNLRKRLNLQTNLKWSLHLTLGLPIPRHEEHSQYLYRLEMM